MTINPRYASLLISAVRRSNLHKMGFCQILWARPKFLWRQSPKKCLSPVPNFRAGNYHRAHSISWLQFGYSQMAGGYTDITNKIFLTTVSTFTIIPKKCDHTLCHLGRILFNILFCIQIKLKLLFDAKNDRYTDVHCTMYNVQCTMYSVQCTLSLS